MDNDFVFCKSVRELMEDLRPEHISEQWWRFADSSKVSLKAVLLHNGNKFPSIPPDGAVHTIETCEKLQLLLQKQKHYEEHRWNIQGEHKVFP
jgi:hypothetical protein